MGWMKGLAFWTCGLGVVGFVATRPLAARPTNPEPNRVWLPTDSWYHPRAQLVREIYHLAYKWSKAPLGETRASFLAQQDSDIENKVFSSSSSSFSSPSSQLAQGSLLQLDVLQRASPLGLSTDSHLSLLRTGLAFRSQLAHHCSLLPSPLPPVVSPVFIVGLPRTGSTLLHALLSLDRAHFRAPLHLEMAPSFFAHDSPGLDPMAPKRSPLYKKRFQAVHSTDLVIPTYRDFLQKLHPFTLAGPEDDSMLLAYAGVDTMTSAFLNEPKYMQWLLDPASKHAHYAFFARFLQARQYAFSRKTKTTTSSSSSSNLSLIHI